MKRLVSIFFLVFVCVGLFGQKPKLINYYLGFNINTQQTIELAKWDVIVLDMENQHLHPDMFSLIRSINPDIKILAYITSQEIYDVIDEDKVLRKKLKSGIQDSWWLKELDGSGIVFWSGTHMLNCSNQCPNVGGQNWSKYLGNFITKNILSNNIWDGVFLDNCWDVMIETIDNRYINYDIDNNTVWDDPNWRNQEWLIGMDTLIATIRSAYPEKIIVGNGGHTFLQYLNGSLIENFHDWETSWEIAMSKYFNSYRNGVNPSLTAINCYNKNQYDYRKMRYGLTSCLLGDGYYSFDYGNTDHNQLWWYDEYDAKIGTALEEAKPVFGNQNVEMLKNTGFENPLTNTWVVDPNTDYGNIYWDNTTSHSGNYSMKCTLKRLPNSSSYYAFTVKQTGFSVERDSLYKISFWAKASSPRIVSTMILLDKDPWKHLFYKLPKSQIGEKWQYFEYYVFMNGFDTLKINKSIPQDTRLSFELGWDLSTVWIDDVSLIKCSPSLWKREYSNALVLCNPTKTSKTVIIAQPYYTVKGELIPVINGKSTVTVDTLDGLILLKTKPEAGLVSQNKNESIVVYPNPNNGVFYMNSENIDNIESIRLLNLEGKVLSTLKQSTKNPNQIILPAKIKSGTYLLKVSLKQGDKIQKIIVRK